MILNKSSLEHLIDQAITRGLVTDYAETPALVYLTAAEEEVVLDPEEARLFLGWLLRSNAVKARPLAA